MSLSVETELTTVELTLLRVLRLAFQKRLAAQATIAALRAAAFSYSAAVTDGNLVFVTDAGSGLGGVFEWSITSTATDDGASAVKPTSVAGAGRWLRCADDWTYGPNANAPLIRRAQSWAREVLLYEGEDDGQALLERIGNNVPAVLLRWIGDDPQSLLQPGSQYRNEHTFNLLLMSRNARQPGLSPDAITGSAVPADAANDPGINSMIGQVRKLLSGLELLEGAQPLEVGAAALGTASSYNEDGTLGERFFVAIVELRVKTAYDIPDEDLLEDSKASPEPELADTAPDETQFDPGSYITAGLGVATGPGLARTIPAGAVKVGGIETSTAETPVTFDANSETYRDVVLATGELTFTAVAIGDSEPDLADGSLRVGVTRTNDTDVADDIYLASTSQAFAFID